MTASTNAPVTRPSLFIRLNDLRDKDAWAEFCRIYGPLVYQYGRRHALQDADAADLVQEVFRVFADSAGEFRYDPSRGSFRSWLFTVARTKRINLGLKGNRQPRGSGDSEVLRRLNEVADRTLEPGESAEWDRAFEQRLFDWGAARIRGEFRESTWRAFWMTAIDGATPQSAAAALGITVGAVYAARYRVTARLREVIAQARMEDRSL
jgi:RNA polymerase sigma factor (sigma-70 family)